MSVALVQSAPQGELQRLLEFANNFGRERQPYLEVLQKPTRKLDYRTGTPANSLERRYLFEEYPALALGVYIDVYY
jgi:hypothetical protein